MALDKQFLPASMAGFPHGFAVVLEVMKSSHQPDGSLSQPSSKSSGADILRVYRYLHLLLRPERRFIWLGVLYGVGIGLLSLATPISVQMLINTVANIGLTTQLVVLSSTLFGLLLLAGLLSALRIQIMDLFGRRFYARMMSEITLRALYAQSPYFEDDNNGPLFNRYFDIINVIKALPNLVVGGFTIVLQMLVGFVLVSLYHPYFFLFNLVLLFCIWLVWLLWGSSAIRSAVALSHQKHEAAAWVESMGGANSFFKSPRQIELAIDRAEELTASYVDHHRLHFRHHFSQTLCFLFIYALASAALLGIGGWLVIEGQLSLGQLVAAELVLSAVFVGLSQLGIYLAYYYDLCAAIDELSLFYDIQQNDLGGENWQAPESASLEFIEVLGMARGRPACLNFKVESGTRVYAHALDPGLQRFTTKILKRHERPDNGLVCLAGADIAGLSISALGLAVQVLDRPGVVELTIRNYLRYVAEGASAAAQLAALGLAGLGPTIAQLPQGLDTQLASTGWPLSTTETMQLKLAGAVLAEPSVLILNQLYDLVNPVVLQRSLDELQTNARTTVVYFSNRTLPQNYDSYLFIDRDRQQHYPSYAAMMEAEGREALGEPAVDIAGGAPA